MVTSAYGDRPDPATPRPVDCCLSARVGMLTEAGLDLWWTVAAGQDTSEAAIGHEVSAVVEASALPFLRRFETLDAVLGLLKVRPSGRKGDALVHPMAPAIRFAYAAAIYRARSMHVECAAMCDEAARAAAKTPIDEHVARFCARMRAR